MTKTYEFYLTIDVHDEQALRKAAERKAVKVLGKAEWDSVRGNEPDPVAADLQVLFDLDMSLEGASILESRAERLIVDDDEAKFDSEDDAF